MEGIGKLPRPSSRAELASFLDVAKYKQQIFASADGQVVLFSGAKEWRKKAGFANNLGS